MSRIFLPAPAPPAAVFRYTCACQKSIASSIQPSATVPVPGSIPPPGRRLTARKAEQNAEPRGKQLFLFHPLSPAFFFICIHYKKNETSAEVSFRYIV